MVRKTPSQGLDVVRNSRESYKLGDKATSPTIAMETAEGDYDYLYRNKSTNGQNTQSKEYAGLAAIMPNVPHGDEL
jgi:hypothetical protein